MQRELSQVDKGIERLLTAYQEELLSLEQLRERMPMLRQRQQALRADLQAITDQANDRAAFLRLAETLTAFLTRLRSASESLSVMERQKIVRLLVKEILVGEDTITIRHSIPIPSAPPQNGGSEALNGQHYLLCKGRDDARLRQQRSRSLIQRRPGPEEMIQEEVDDYVQSGQRFMRRVEEKKQNSSSRHQATKKRKTRNRS